MEGALDGASASDTNWLAQAFANGQRLWKSYSGPGKFLKSTIFDGSAEEQSSVITS